MPNALITGASAGLGRALALALAARGWGLVVDGRRPDALARVSDELQAAGGTVAAVVGDVADDAHRRMLVAAAQRLDGLDLLVNNASTLGPMPLRPVIELSSSQLSAIFEVNVVAPDGTHRGRCSPADTVRGGHHRLLRRSRRALSAAGVATARARRRRIT